MTWLQTHIAPFHAFHVPPPGGTDGDRYLLLSQSCDIQQNRSILVAKVDVPSPQELTTPPMQSFHKLILEDDGSAKIIIRASDFHVLHGPSVLDPNTMPVGCLSGTAETILVRWLLALYGHAGLDVVVVDALKRGDFIRRSAKLLQDALFVDEVRVQVRRANNINVGFLLITSSPTTSESPESTKLVADLQNFLDACSTDNISFKAIAIPKTALTLERYHQTRHYANTDYASLRGEAPHLPPLTGFASAVIAD